MGLSEQIALLRRDPASGEVAAIVRSRSRSTGAYSEFVSAFSERAERLVELGSFPEAMSSWIEAALVCEEELGDLRRAASLYQRVLDVDPDNRRALFALGALLHDLRRWDALINLYRGRLLTSQDEAERISLQLYIADLLDDKKGDSEAAFGILLSVVQAVPESARVFNRLCKLSTFTHRESELVAAIVEVLDRQLDPKVRTTLCLKIAEFYLACQDDRSKALTYLREALVDCAGNINTLRDIGELFRKVGRFDELIEIIEDVLDDPRSSDYRVNLLTELARIYEQDKDDIARAFSLLCRGLRHRSDDRFLFDEVMRLGLLGGYLETVAKVYEDILPICVNKGLRTYLRLKLGHIYANILEVTEDARRVYGEILAEEPHHREAQSKLMKLFRRIEDEDGLVELLERMVGRLEGKDAAEAWFELATLREKRGEDAELAYQKAASFGHQQAKESLQRLVANKTFSTTPLPTSMELKTDPNTPPLETLPTDDIVEFSDTHFEAKSNEEPTNPQVDALHDPTRDNISRWLHTAAREDRLIEVLPQIDSLLQDHNLEVQIELGLQIIDRLYEHQEVETSIERAIRLEQRFPESDLCKQGYRKLLRLEQRWQALFQAYVADVSLDADSDRRVSSFTAALNLANSQLSMSTTFPALENIVHNLKDQVLEQLLIEQLETSKAWDWLDQFWVNTLSYLEGEQRSTRRIEIATLRSDVLRDPVGEESILMEGLEERAKDIAITTYLSNLYTRQKRWDELVDLWRRQIQYTEDLEERTKLHIHIAECLTEHFNDFEGARRELEKVLLASPDDLEVLVRLEQIAMTLGDQQFLVEILNKQILVSQPQRTQVFTLLRLFDVLKTISEPEAERVLSSAYNIITSEQTTISTQEKVRADVLIRWAELLGKKGDVPQALTILNTLKDHETLETRKDASYQLGLLRDDKKQSLEEFERALAEAPNYLPAVAAAANLSFDLELWVKAGLLYERASRLELATEKRLGYLSKAAEVSDYKLKDVAKAIKLYEALLAISDDQPAVHARLGKLLIEVEQPAIAREHLERAAEDLNDNERAAELLVMAATTAEIDGQIDEAKELYREALVRVPTHRLALSCLGAMLSAAGDWEEAHDLSAALLLHHESALDPNTRAEIFLSMSLAKSRLQDLEAAERLALRAVDSDPENPSCWLGLADVYEANNQVFAAVEALQKHATLVHGLKKRDSLVRAVDMLETLEEQEHSSKVLELLKRALEETPADFSLAKRVADWIAKFGDVSQAAELLESTACLGKEQAECLCQAGELLRKYSRDEAKRIFTKAFELDPLHARLLAQLSLLLTHDGDFELLYESLVKAVQAEKVSLEKKFGSQVSISNARMVKLWQKILFVAEVHLNDAKRCLDAIDELDRLQSQVDICTEADVLKKLLEEDPVDSKLLFRARSVWAKRVEVHLADASAYKTLAEIHKKLENEYLYRWVWELGEFAGLESVSWDAGLSIPVQTIQSDPHALEVSSSLGHILDMVGYRFLEAFYDDLENMPKRRDLVSIKKLNEDVIYSFQDVARALSIEVPQLYAKDDIKSPVMPAWVNSDKGLIFSPSQVNSLDSLSLRFYIAKAMHLLRPRALAVSLLPLRVLRASILGLVDTAALDVDEKLARQKSRRLGKLLGEDISATIRNEVQRWLKSKNLARFYDDRQAVYWSADRVATTVCGSPRVAFEILGQDALAKGELLKYLLKSERLVSL